MVFHVLVSLRHSKPFLESCSRSQKAHRKELLGHYLADSLGPLPPPCVRMEAGQTSTHRARRIIGVDLFDCQMSEWGHGYVSKRGRHCAAGREKLAGSQHTCMVKKGSYGSCSQAVVAPSMHARSRSSFAERPCSSSW